MMLKKEMASIGLDPFNATVAYGVQSKAVRKNTNFSKQISAIIAYQSSISGREGLRLWY